ncbi:MAG: hypothetical protein ACI8QZ_002081 [Chlamydiales bacterium]|jgi:hypothetical protein
MHMIRRPHAVILVALASACAATPPVKLVAPAVDVTLTHRCGGILAESLVLPAEVDAAQIWAVHVRGLVLAGESNADLVAVASGAAAAASLLFLPNAAEPIRGSVDEITDLRFAVGEEARAIGAGVTFADGTQGLEFSSLRGTLAEGSCTELRVTARDGVSYSITLDRPTAGQSLAADGRVALRYRAPGVGDGLALLSTQVKPGCGPLWVELPMHPGETIGFLIDVSEGTAQDAAHVSAVEASRLDLEAAALRLKLRTATWTAQDAGQAARYAAGAALQDPATRLEALQILAGDGLGLAVDLATCASDTLAEEWATALGPVLDLEHGSAEQVAWTVEQSAIELLATRMDKGIAEVAQEGLLARHLGEMGRFTPDLLRFLRGTGTRADFDVWIQRQNLRLLGSPDPAARVRALDWLTVRGLEPVDFDPLASRDVRRTQLRADEAARAAREQP